MARTAMLAYRPDIDGLRAIAVLSVVLFHIDPAWLPGGFTGVDLFFVISGYLISSILLADLREGKFSFRRFYARRVRRIFPALLLVLLACWVAGWLLLFPEEYRVLNKHITGGALFVPNFVLWKESGYFDEAADLKPLLHLWSLGVEEQFYFLWPPMLLAAWRLKLPLPKVVLALAAISFAVNMGRAEAHAASTFFLPHTRFWELLAGVWLATRQPWAPSPRVANMAAAVGLALIATGFVVIEGTDLYPSWRGLLPVAGAVLLIHAGTQSWFNRVVLSSRPFVWVGLISYPLYLWHWPLMSFARTLGDESQLTLSLLAVLAVVLAWFTYRFVEYPLRHHFTPERQRRWVIGSLVLMAVIGSVTYGCYKAGGLRELRGFTDTRFDDIGRHDQYRKALPLCGIPQAKGIAWCHRARADEPVTAVLFGDSHADHLFAAMAAHDTKRNWLLLGRSSCPPILEVEVERREMFGSCIEHNQLALETIASQTQARTVALAMVMPYYITDEGYAKQHTDPGSRPEDLTLRSARADEKQLSERDTFVRGMERMVEALQAQGKQVVMILDVPEVPYLPSQCFSRSVGITHSHAQRVGCSVPEAKVLERQKEYRTIMAALVKKYPGVKLYDTLPLLCQDGACAVGTSDMLYYRDSHHLSYRGSDYVTRRFTEWLDAQ